MFSREIALLVILAALGGCSSLKETDTGRTATEQLLISRAVDRAVDQLGVQIPAGSSVFVEDRFVEGADAKYVLASIRDKLLRQGVQLSEDKGQAAMVMEVRLGALGIEDDSWLLGIPKFGVPVPLTSNASTPEIALYKRRTRQGVIKLATVTRNAGGTLVQATDPVYGFSHTREKTLLLFFSWDDNDLMPPDQKENGWVRN